MAYDRPIIQTTNFLRKDGTVAEISRSIFYGEVISIDDETDGGRIKVRIKGIDNHKSIESLPWCFPLLPKFFHVYPQVGEYVRIFLENNKYPEIGRYWLGSIISQLHKTKFDSIYTALSTTDAGISKPDPAPTTYPDANNLFPNKTDIGIIGRINTDIILKPNQIQLRAGKHENGEPLKLNKKNPSEITLSFEDNTGKGTYQSNTVINSDKIALISHEGLPNFKSNNLDTDDRKKVFEEGHPIPRGDVLIQALELMRRAIINHIHGYSNLPADKNAIINDLEKINFDNILQKNIVIN